MEAALRTKLSIYNAPVFDDILKFIIRHVSV